MARSREKENGCWLPERKERPSELYGLARKTERPIPAGRQAGIDPVTQPKENACEVQKANTAKWSPAPALRLGRSRDVD